MPVPDENGNPYFDVAFAVDGNLTPVPDGIQPTGSVSYTQGWGPYYSQDPAVDPSTALLIDRAQTNQMFNSITQAVQAYQQFGTPAFITSAMNGGSPFSYAEYARVVHGGVVYQSLVAANTDTPPSSKWAIVSVLNAGIPQDNETGTNYNPVDSDLGKIITRNNAGTAMADTLAGVSSPLPAGWFAYLQNTDASAVDNVGVGSGGSISVGNQAAADSFTVYPGETWLAISLGSGNYTAGRIETATLHTNPVQGSFKNLVGVYDSHTTATFTADQIVLQDLVGNTRRVSGFNQTLNTGVAGIGGLSTGSLTDSTWYAVYAALKVSTNQSGIFIDTSFTAPTIPGGYSSVALIGAIRIDGSGNIIGFKQADRRWQYVLGSNLSVLPIMASGASAGNTWAAVAVAAFAPPNAQVITPLLNNWDNTSQSGKFASVAPNSNYAAADSTDAGTGAPISFGSSANTASGAIGDIVLESSNIYYASNWTHTVLTCFGFTLNL